MMPFLRRLWVYTRPYKKRLVAGLLFGCTYAFASGLLMVLVKLVVNLSFAGHGEFSFHDQLAKAPAFLKPLAHALEEKLPTIKSPTSRTGQVLLISLLPLLMLLRGVSGYLNIYLTNWAATRSIANLRTKLFEHLQNQSLTFYNSARTGDLITRVINDTSVLHGIISNSMASLLKDPLTLIALVTINLLQPETRQLTLVSLVVLPICVGPILAYAKRVRKSARAMQGHIGDMSNVMHEAFTGVRIIKAYNLEAMVSKRFQDALKKYISHTMRVVRANELPSQITEFLGVMGVALVLIYVTFQHQATPGDFVQFLLSIVLIYQPVKTMARLYNQLNQASSSSSRVFEYLEMKNPMSESANPAPLEAAGKAISFDKVDFDYGEKPVLRGISLSVPAGRMVALVGRSGSGKTTIANLLLRFYDPKSGVVRIGGTDIRDVSIRNLREQIALVAQETVLFNDTIRQNIRLGRPDASDAEIENAARHAHAHDFIMDKPHAYETIVGEKGVSLSVGQRQRISIARALLRNAPILILDEATSALDSESERAVQEGFEELMQGRTTICIAHRLSTIQKADTIVVLEGGRIVESGTHAQLIEQRGVYCKLYELQFEPALA
jgi:subfamily B ATP-binding cassette protein MsbA